MVRILMLYLDPALRPAVYALTGTLLLERITSAFARDIVLQRLWLLVLSVVAIALFTWRARSPSIRASVSDGTCRRSSDG